MSPEQAKGRDADKRSDVWSFGAVLYEMLSGERAFKGEDIPDALAAVLRADVDWSRVPAPTPESLRHLLTRCLERDLTRRLRDIGEARILLDDLIRGESPSSPAPARVARRGPGWRHVVLLATVALASGLVVATVLSRPDSSAPRNPIRFALSMPVAQGLLIDPQSRDLGLSPDGSLVVYKGGPRADQSQAFYSPPRSVGAKASDGFGSAEESIRVSRRTVGGVLRAWWCITSWRVRKEGGDWRRACAQRIEARRAQPRRDLGRRRHHHRGVRCAGDWSPSHPCVGR